MANKKKKSKLTAQQTLSILMAAVNGFNSIAPLTLPLAALTAEAVPLQRQFIQEDLYSQLPNGGQILDKLFFSTAYAYTPEVTSGMTVTGETLTNTDYQEIRSGGTAISTTITNSGRQAIYSGGTATSTMINSAGQFLSGGTAISTSLESGSYQFVGSSSTASSTVIHSGAIQAVSNGLATSTSILNGGVQEIYSFGSATSTTIGNGGTQIVDSEGSTTLTIINNGGTQEINTGGNGNITTINSGGIQNVNDGGKATATSINKGGIQNVNFGGKSVSATINNGGIQNVADSALSLDTKIVSGGTQTVTVGGAATRTSIDNGGIQIISGGLADATTINNGGIQYVGRDSYVFSSTINSGGTQYLQSDAETSYVTVNAGGTVSLLDPGSAYLTNVITSGGTFILATTGTIGNNITLSNPQGSANFVINTDLANNQSDHITIEGGSTTNTVKVNYDPSFGQGPTISGSARFATVTDETTTFTGVATDSGAYRYTPILSSVLVSSGDNGAEDFSIQSVREDHVEWYITGLSGGGTAASETMYTAHDAVANTLTLWRDENNHLIRRMGDLRTGSGQTGDWARVYSGEQELNSIDGRRTTQKYTALQGGHDTKHVSDSGTRFTGYTLGYLNADATMERGTGDASSISIGAYSSWFGNKGHFLDLILKQGRLKNSFTSYLKNADNTRVDASYNNWGTSLSAEYGFRKVLSKQWYVEPQAEITLNRITGANFTTSDGTSVSQGGLNSVIGRLGVMVGKTVKQNSFYLQASLLREFNAHSDVTMSSGGLTPVTMSEDLKETYMEFALGITRAFNDRTSGYFEASKTTGDKVRTPWLLNAGIRRSF
ncbi:autotransporter outer membrane beta-barrel domain-containing protein [Anaerospora hongkongensis]|uniref:autotransporter outer membrane beta-barrel domain-containing protein n=1 Tax=Anaerospora hongkongensis TaxID=244830 RepID=UPI00289F677E|nr:autotransporter outer membrane beta-barrel domain-containing protein [Anaerospora hongkongensis]